MDLQMRVAEEAKKQRVKYLPNVLFIFDDLVDDEQVLHNNHNLIATLTTSGRHFSAHMWCATQKFRGLANVIKINLTALFIWPALSNRLERKGHHRRDIGPLLRKGGRRSVAACCETQAGFLFVNLKADDPSEMFQDGLVQKLRVTSKHADALHDAAQEPRPRGAE
jgi:hypothetical protein